MQDSRWRVGSQTGSFHPAALHTVMDALPNHAIEPRRALATWNP
jgi:hypothetical protein